MEKKLIAVSLAEFQAHLDERKQQGVYYAPQQYPLDADGREHAYPYVDPVTNTVGAMVEIPLDATGKEREDEKVYYVLTGPTK